MTILVLVSNHGEPPHISGGSAAFSNLGTHPRWMTCFSRLLRRRLPGAWDPFKWLHGSLAKQQVSVWWKMFWQQPSKMVEQLEFEQRKMGIQPANMLIWPTNKCVWAQMVQHCGDWTALKMLVGLWLKTRIVYTHMYIYIHIGRGTAICDIWVPPKWRTFMNATTYTQTCAGQWILVFDLYTILVSSLGSNRIRDKSNTGLQEHDRLTSIELGTKSGNPTQEEMNVAWGTTWNILQTEDGTATGNRCPKFVWQMQLGLSHQPKWKRHCEEPRYGQQLAYALNEDGEVKT